MKQLFHVFLVSILAVSLSACGSSEPQTSETEQPETKEEEPVPEEPVITWEEEFEEGKKLLEAQNYEEAIEAFTRAIDIDNQEAPVFIRRGDAYVGIEQLQSAWDDYETAAKIDENNPEAYLGMADVHIRRNEFDEALELLGSAPSAVKADAQVAAKAEEMKSGTYMDSSRNIRRADEYDTDGNLVFINVYEFEGNRRTGWTNYTVENGIETLYEKCFVTYGSNGLPEKHEFYDANGAFRSSQTMEYDGNGLETRRNVYDNNGEFVAYYLNYYDENGNEIKYEGYLADGTLMMYETSEYDSSGRRISSSVYDGAGNLTGTKTYDY